MAEDGGGAGPGDPIALRDEVLELFFWMEGEGFDDQTSLAGMMRFLAFPEREVETAIADLVARGEVVPCADGTFRLSADGRREAARRFADDFAPLQRRGHGECDDPACDCHTGPEAAAECHARAERPTPAGS